MPSFGVSEISILIDQKPIIVFDAIIFRQFGARAIVISAQSQVTQQQYKLQQ